MKERWWTAPAAGDGGGDVIVTGRDYMDDIIAKGKFNIRVDVRWDYCITEEGKPFYCAVY